jgi:hypothetical protein
LNNSKPLNSFEYDILGSNKHKGEADGEGENIIET